MITIDIDLIYTDHCCPLTPANRLVTSVTFVYGLNYLPEQTANKLKARVEQNGVAEDGIYLPSARMRSSFCQERKESNKN